MDSETGEHSLVFEGDAMAESHSLTGTLTPILHLTCIVGRENMGLRPFACFTRKNIMYAYSSESKCRCKHKWNDVRDLDTLLSTE